MGHISTPDKTREIPLYSDGNTLVMFGGVPKTSFKLIRPLQPEGIEVDSSQSTRHSTLSIPATSIPQLVSMVVITYGKLQLALPFVYFLYRQQLPLRS
jgi:hypothetical protein